MVLPPAGKKTLPCRQPSAPAYPPTRWDGGTEPDGLDQILALEGANGVDLGGFLDAADGALSSLSLG